MLPFHETHVNAFFNAVAPHVSVTEPRVSYVAVRGEMGFVLLQGRLFLDSRTTTRPFRSFQSETVRAGTFKLSDTYENPRLAVESLLNGSLQLPEFEGLFLERLSGGYGSGFQPFHPDGIQSQSRIAVLQILGVEPYSFLSIPDVDWELRAADLPYDSLNELMLDYRLGGLRSDNSNFEIVGFAPIGIDVAASNATDEEATIVVRLETGLDAHEVDIGVRILDQRETRDRSSHRGPEITWDSIDGYQRGRLQIPIPKGSLVQTFARFRRTAYHYWWLVDPATVPNVRTCAYQTFDSDMSILDQFLSKEGRGNARDLETGVAWLFWMLGFSVAHLGGTAKTQDAADLIAISPLGHLAVVECTTGILSSDRKIPLLLSRCASVLDQLQRSNHNHVRVLPVMVTSRPTAEIESELEIAHRHGVLVVAREDLDQLRTRISVPVDADELFQNAEELVRANRSTPESENLL